MKRCVVCGRETYHKFEEYTVCAACDVGGSFDYYIKQSIAAQQNAHPTLGKSADLQAVPEAETLSTSDSVPKSAPARVA